MPAPLLLLVGLLLSGRAGPLPAVLAAIAVALPAAFVSLPAGVSFPGFVLDEALRGAFLASQPIGVVVGASAGTTSCSRRPAGTR